MSRTDLGPYKTPMFERFPCFGKLQLEGGDTVNDLDSVDRMFVHEYVRCII